MAGNTKLMGFTPEGKVQLERWGCKAVVSVSPDSLSALRRACYTELPKKPTQRRRDDISGWDVSYDEQVGRILLDLDVEKATILADLVAYRAAHSEELTDDLAEMLSCWASNLMSSVQAHHDYLNKDGEPGVADDD